MQTAKKISNRGVKLIKKGNTEEGYELLKQAFKMLADENIKKNLLLANKKVYIKYFLNKDYLQTLKYTAEALNIDPDNSDAHLYRGNAYFLTGHFDHAGYEFLKAIDSPLNGQPIARLIDAKSHMCDWSNLKKLVKKLDNLNSYALRRRVTPPEMPFQNLIRVANEKQNYEIAKRHSRTVAASYPQITIHNSQRKLKINNSKLAYLAGGSKIKVGYLSDGFRNFPTGNNLIKILENHDHTTFDIFCYSWGKNENSKTRSRFQRASNFVDITSLDDTRAATKIAHDNIDILVDLKGYTLNNRIDILAQKPAPIQISYLGFPGTTGADFIDYIIADKTVIPIKSQKYYSEKVLYMEGCYRPIDTGYALDFVSKKQLRNQYKLPVNAFIFASFNQSYKITPEMFNLWLDILNNVPESYIWQLKSNSYFHNNLAKHTDRIIYADEVDRPSHLQRLSAADLALDTYPTNGHSTTVDALISGLPVLTVKGRHFSSRVTESVLKQFDLTNLVTKNLQGYKNLAIKLATNKKSLQVINWKLEIALKKSDFFKADRYTRKLERLYKNVYLSKLPVWNGKAQRV